MTFTKQTLVAGAFALAMPFTAAQAATITGDIDLVYFINLGTSSPGFGDVDYDTAYYLGGTGDFAGGTVGATFAMSDINAALDSFSFSGTGGTPSFTASNVTATQLAGGGQTFDVEGIFSIAGLMDTVGIGSLTYQGSPGNNVTRVSGSLTATAVAVAAVPLPAGGLLLMTALGGAGFAARRRKTKSKA